MPQPFSYHVPVTESEDVEPDTDRISTVALQSHSLWSSFLDEAQKHIVILKVCFQVETLLGPVPPYPQNWPALKTTTRPSIERSSELHVSGRAYWEARQNICTLKHKVPHPKALDKNLLLGIQRPIEIELVEDSPFSEWPGHSSAGNYIALFVFAWSYILSAKWTELSCRGKIEYQLSEPQDLPTAIEIDIDLPGEAQNWWAAISRQGWKATVTHLDAVYQSPWSLQVVHTSQVFRVRGNSPSLDMSPPDFKSALRFLIDVCNEYGLHDQCFAALSISLLLPTVRYSRNRLPLPKNYQLAQQPSSLYSPLSKHVDLIPYYMSIACNSAPGLMAVLAAPFYNSSIACNFVSAWLDPIFEIINPLLKDNQLVLLNVLSLREPRLAPLWLGAIILGITPLIFRNAQRGISRIDLVASAWTGVHQSFLTVKSRHERGGKHFGSYVQEKDSLSMRAQDAEEPKLQRADECRLLFFLNCEGYERPPICAWHPFGSIELKDATIEVREHSACGHSFEYTSWRWDMPNGYSSVTAGYHGLEIKEESTNLTELSKSKPKFPSQLASETATQNAFNWLRVDGWAKDERHIWKHPWLLEDWEGDESTESTNEVSNSYSSETVVQWLSGVEEYSCRYRWLFAKLHSVVRIVVELFQTIQRSIFSICRF